jgi:hypothetical protein
VMPRSTAELGSGSAQRISIVQAFPGRGVPVPVERSGAWARRTPCSP